MLPIREVAEIFLKAATNRETANPASIRVLEKLAVWDEESPISFDSDQSLGFSYIWLADTFRFALDTNESLLNGSPHAFDETLKELRREAKSEQQECYLNISVIDSLGQELPGSVFSGGVIWSDDFILHNPHSEIDSDEKVQMIVYDSVRYLPLQVFIQLLGLSEDLERFDLEGWEIDAPIDPLLKRKLRIRSNVDKE